MAEYDRNDREVTVEIRLEQPLLHAIEVRARALGVSPSRYLADLATADLERTAPIRPAP